MLESLIEAAREGARVITAARGPLEARVQTKSSHADLVTEVDFRVQEAVADVLRRHVPGACVIAEEASTAAVAPDRIYLDPIDGTLNFVHGFSEHCISIGYWSAESPVAGVVLKPSTGDLFVAERGRGAFRNGEPIHVSARHRLCDALLATGWPYDKSLTDRALLQMRGFIGRCQEIRIIGSAALAMCYVAAGILDGFWETGLEAWDLAAGTVIALEAGAAVTAHDGRPFRLETGAVLASSGHLHACMQAILAQPGRGKEDSGS